MTFVSRLEAHEPLNLKAIACPGMDLHLHIMKVSGTPSCPSEPRMNLYWRYLRDEAQIQWTLPVVVTGRIGKGEAAARSCNEVSGTGTAAATGGAAADTLNRGMATVRLLSPA